MRTEFQNGSLTYGDDSREDAARGEFGYELQTPWRLSTGVTYTGGPLLLSADVEFVDWSQAHLDADTEAPVIDRANQTLDEYSYVFNWRGGAEYRSDSGLALRAGVAYRPGARGFDFTLADGEETDRSRLFLSAGAGVQLSARRTNSFRMRALRLPPPPRTRTRSPFRSSTRRWCGTRCA
jgi:long-subunit fatty acid transport protein